MNSDIITVFQDYNNEVPGFNEHLDNLYALSDIIGKENFSLQANGTLQIMDYIGFFQRGHTRIQILPKIYAKSVGVELSGAELNDSLNFVYRLLSWSGYLSHKKLPPQLQSSSASDLLEIFVGIFITEFLDLFSKKINRNYIQQEHNQQFIKGRILFSETARKNPILKHLHVVRYDEYTINNPLNRLFKALIVMLLTRTTDSYNKRMLVRGINYLEEVDLKPLSTLMYKAIRFDRLNADFEPLFNMAKLFFHNSQPGLKDGKEKTFSFLVPIHLLFETFVGKVLGEFFNNRCVVSHGGPQLHLATCNNEGAFLLKPDFTIQTHEGITIILDTKFKYPFDKKGGVAISKSDLYQVTAYALRYNCKQLYLLYPKFIGVENEASLLAEYFIESAAGRITLSVIQIDVMEKDIEKIGATIKTHFNFLDKAAMI
ncbi:hypothetical protein EXU57_08230 [Segetibacter sp. 3557_3]|uniref:McrC family protein n=1 Tax=Segetibacter sp. 3557_3 TaxID=2547429 RepID=UPI001058D9F8|nr:hypothetical protein [Segetibacter sp. 3557_3]TDH26789.1 hypothetical protein EXU57_08230 [Segetibacter sp. 3557_3]